MVLIPSPSPSASIFKTPLRPTAAGQADEKQKQARARNLKTGWIYLGLAALLLLSYSYYFLYPQTQAFLEAPERLQAMNQEITEHDENSLPNLRQNRDLKKAAFEEELTEVERNLNIIFPSTLDKVGIVKRLENFATAIESKNPPFEFNAITFGQPVRQENSTILPISTSIQSSRANFERFLELIELSGKLDSEIPIRLIEISNIDIRYRGTDPRTGKDQGVDFTVKLNAYSHEESR